MIQSILRRQGPSQGTKHWLEARKNVITATDISALIGSNPYQTRQDIIDKKKSNSTFQSNPAMDWGTAFEEIAADCYRQKHDSSKQIETGLVYHSNIKFLAASPDRIIHSSTEPYLIEIKCPYKRSLSAKPARMYLHQVQHQLEVTNLSYGYLWECSFGLYNTLNEYNNDNQHTIKGYDKKQKRYWYLNESRLTKVVRDKEWYSKEVLPILRKFNRSIKSSNKSTTKTNKKRKRGIKYMPSDVINYIQQDVFLDWLDMHPDQHDYEQDVPGKFMRLMMEQKYKLKQSIIERYPKNSIQKCSTIAETLSAMKKGVLLIDSPVLNYNKLSMEVRPTFLMKDEVTNQGYRAVQIQFKKLKTLKESEYLSLERSQVYSQTVAYWGAKALEELNVNYVEPWVIGANGQHHLINTERLIQQYDTKWTDALEWKRELKTDKQHKTALPGDNVFMLPNMCSSRGTRWQSAKAAIAKEKGDITQVWKCTPRHRSNAFEEGVYSIMDPNCTAETLHFGERFSSPTPDANNQNKLQKSPQSIRDARAVDAILNQARSKQIRTPKSWKGLIDHCPEDCYIDLEFINDTLFGSPHPTMIYMIGIGYKDSKNKWQKVEFIADKLTYEAEEKILRQWINWVSKRPSTPRCFHWSAAEPSQFKKAYERHGLNPANVSFVDLMKIFIESPLTVKGCYNFKLKNITKALHSHHLIKTNYDDSECNNGADAMLLCWQHYGFIGQDVDYEVSPMTQIIEYNRIDTKVLEDIHSLF